MRKLKNNIKMGGSSRNRLWGCDTGFTFM